MDDFGRFGQLTGRSSNERTSFLSYCKGLSDYAEFLFPLCGGNCPFDDGFRLLQQRQMDHALAGKQPVQLVEHADFHECRQRNETFDVGRQQYATEQCRRPVGFLPALSRLGAGNEQSK
jgi:hypothetical protein